MGFTSHFSFADIYKETLMNLKKIIKEELLNEADVNPLKLPSVKNAEAGSDAALARAQFLQNKVEKNLSSLGVYGLEGYMDEQGIFTVEMVQKAKTFKFSFKTENGDVLNGHANYDFALSKKYSTMVLNFDSDDQNIKIMFSKESLKRPFMSKSNIFGSYKGNRSALIGMQEDTVVDVRISNFDPPIMGSTKIKILEIGIVRSKSDKKSKELVPGKYYPVKAEIDFENGNDEDIFTSAVKEEISNRISEGDFYVSLSKARKDMLIFSTSPNSSGDFFTVKKPNVISPKDISSWRGNVLMDNKPLGRPVSGSIQANISYIDIDKD